MQSYRGVWVGTYCTVLYLGRVSQGGSHAVGCFFFLRPCRDSSRALGCEGGGKLLLHSVVGRTVVQ